MPNGDNGWNEWGRHVLSELERLNDCVEKLNDRLTNLQIKMAGIGAVAGLIMALVVALVQAQMK